MMATQLLNVTYILIAAGQSNTHYGYKLERAKDSLDFSRVLQIPSIFVNGSPLLTAVHEGNIGHFSRETGRIGFITRTAVKFRQNHAANKGRVVIIPAGLGDSGWSDALYDRQRHWRADGPVFQNLVTRIVYARDQLLGEFAAFLWHQGESDVGTQNYKYVLQTFIASMREYIGVLDCPFVLGEMAWNWVWPSARNIAQQGIIKSIIDDVPHTAVVSSAGLHSIPGDPIHFSAASQREFRSRYYAAIAAARANTSPRNYSPAARGARLILNHQISTGGYFANVLEAYYYGLSPNGPRYSRLGELWRCRNKDGWYKLQLLANGRSITWRQKINPLGAWRESYTPIELLENSLGVSKDRFQGLYVMRSTSPGAKAAGIPALLTADTGLSWYFAVGSVQPFLHGVHPLNEWPLIVADRITLYAFVD